MRMDDWHPAYVFRWQAAPVAGGAFFDDEASPRAVGLLQHEFEQHDGRDQSHETQRRDDRDDDPR